MSETYRLMVVVGEPSGDAHAAALVRALRSTAPRINFEFFGATGPLMRKEQVETIVNSDSLAIMGIVEVGRVFPRFLRAFRELKDAALVRKPDAVILVDWPEFNLRLASALHRRGFKVIYYISPQLWAWRSRRIKTIKRHVDLMLAILPFEVEWYKARGVDHIEFVGHPLSGEVHARYGREEFCRKHNLAPSKPVVALLPGSRHKELIRILPPMLDAVDQLVRQRPDVQPLIVVAPSRRRNEVIGILSARSLKPPLTIVEHETREALAAADAAAVASGTATLEAALLGTPMVIVYKESSINWHTLGRLITVDHYGLVNLIAGKRLVTELMQDELTGERLCEEIVRLLDPVQNQKMRSQLHAIKNQLGESEASERAARSIVTFLRALGSPTVG
ncbi:MAG TPA: lipid-A-disaccharide synthase [Pyrinomonadaceae bacterium]|nr:lipid-A-disaccharide synthase [Pyrinomonadaceae bacterium]